MAQRPMLNRDYLYTVEVAATDSTEFYEVAQHPSAETAIMAAEAMIQAGAMARAVETIKTRYLIGQSDAPSEESPESEEEEPAEEPVF